MFRCLFPLVFLLTLLACSPAERVNKFDKEAITESVKQMFENYHNDIKENGLTAEFHYLDHSSDFFWVPPGYQSALNYDSVKAILEKNAKKFSNVQFHWDTLQIFPLSNEIANYSGIVGGFLKDTSGVASTISIIESGTVIKRKDGWKLLSGQSANILK